MSDRVLTDQSEPAPDADPISLAASVVSAAAGSRSRLGSGLLAVALTTGTLVGCAEPESSTATVAPAVEVVTAGAAATGSTTAPVATADSNSSGDDYSSVWGPAIGSTIPMLAAADQQGQPQTLESLAGDRGLLLVFSRSADW